MLVLGGVTFAGSSEAQATKGPKEELFWKDPCKDSCGVFSMSKRKIKGKSACWKPCRPTSNDEGLQVMRNSQKKCLVFRGLAGVLAISKMLWEKDTRTSWALSSSLQMAASPLHYHHDHHDHHDHHHHHHHHHHHRHHCRTKQFKKHLPTIDNSNNSFIYIRFISPPTLDSLGFTISRIRLPMEHPPWI